MSITSAIYTGNSGLLADSDAINVIGNNLANQNTIGFKSGNTLFSTLLSQNIGNNSQVGTGVQVQAIQNQFSSGTLESTSNVTDLAISGNGFFALAAPTATSATAATAYYTQAGSFSVSATNGLVNPNGYQVLDTAGAPIVFPSSATDASGNALTFQNVSAISSTGVISCLYSDAAGDSATLYYAGAGNAPATTTAGAVNIAEVDVPNPEGMQSQGGTLFTLTNASGTPAALTSANGTTETIVSNKLEESNVDMGSEMVNLINVQSSYSANSKTITTANEMAQDLLNLIH
jgi:flagellar hook protein FlgE